MDTRRAACAADVDNRGTVLVACRFDPFRRAQLAVAAKDEYAMFAHEKSNPSAFVILADVVGSTAGSKLVARAPSG